MINLNIRKNVSTTVVAFFINILLTFVGYRLVVQQGGTSALGVWSILSAAIFIIRIGDVGMGSSAERHVAMVNAEQDSRKVRGYLDTAIIINGALFTALALIGWVVFSYKMDWIVPAASHLQQQAHHILPLMLMVFIVSNIANVVSGGLRGLHLAYQSAYLGIAGGVLQFLIIVFSVPKVGIAGLAWGQLVQNIFILIAAWVLFNRQVFKFTKDMSYFPIHGSKELFRELFSFSIRAQIVNLINGVFEPISKFIIGHSAGMSTLGLYEMAYKMVALPRNAIVSGVLGMTPSITHLLIHDKAQAIALYRRSKKLVTLATGVMMLGVFLISPIASFFLLKHIDWMLVSFVCILAIGFWVNAIGAPAYIIGFSMGKMNINLRSSILSIVSLIFFSLLINGATILTYGGVIATAVGLGLSGLYVLWGNEKQLVEIK